MNDLLQRTGLFLKRNAPTILTCVGAVGVGLTAVSVGKATPKAMALLEEAKREKGEELTTVEKVIVAGPAYIPAAVLGVGTITCMFGANVLNKKHQAALTSAYALLDGMYKEYKHKLTELFGDEMHSRIITEMARDRYEEFDILEERSEDDEKQLFFDFYSMNYFESTEADVLEAARRVNQLYNDRGYVSLNEYYDFLGMPNLDFAYELGWSKRASNDSYGYSEILFEYEHFTVESDHDILEVCGITMPFEPTTDFMFY